MSLPFTLAFPEKVTGCVIVVELALSRVAAWGGRGAPAVSCFTDRSMGASRELVDVNVS